VTILKFLILITIVTNMNRSISVLLLSFVIIFYYGYVIHCLNSNADAHIFVSSDDNAAYLTLIERVRIEALLANDTLHSNLTASREHIEQLQDRLDDVIDSQNYFVVKSTQFDNLTVDALFLANIVDEVLVYYGGAYGILPNIMLNMSSMSSPMSSMPSMPSKSSPMSSMPSMPSNNNSIFNMAKYQFAKEYAKRAIEIFNAKLKPYDTKNNNTNTMKGLESSLIELRAAVDRKAQPMQIMMIAHTKIHPYLQLAYNLKVKIIKT